MATTYPLPSAATPIEHILSRFDRKQIEAFITIAIDLLDVANDPDAEDDGTGGDWSRPEWHTAGRHKEPAFITETKIAVIYDPEDREEDDAAEDDDPAGGNVEDQGEETYLSPVMPEYGEDQSRGPINVNERF